MRSGLSAAIPRVVLLVLLCVARPVPAQEDPVPDLTLGPPIVDRERGLVFRVPRAAEPCTLPDEQYTHGHRLAIGEGRFQFSVKVREGIDAASLPEWVEACVASYLQGGRELVRRDKGEAFLGTLAAIDFEGEWKSGGRWVEETYFLQRGERGYLLEFVYPPELRTRLRPVVRAMVLAARPFVPGDKRMDPPEPHTAVEAGRVRVCAATNVPAARATALAEECEGLLAVIGRLTGAPAAPARLPVHAYATAKALCAVATDLPVDPPALVFVPAGGHLLAHVAAPRDRAAAERVAAEALVDAHLAEAAGSPGVHTWARDTCVEWALAHRRAGKEWKLDKKASPAFTALRDASKAKGLGPLLPWLREEPGVRPAASDPRAARALGLALAVSGGEDAGRRELVVRYVRECRATGDPAQALEAALGGCDTDALERDWREAWLKK